MSSWTKSTISEGRDTFLLKVINLSKTVMIKTSNSMGSEGREEYNAADCLSIKREATKLVVVCTCT